MVLYVDVLANWVDKVLGPVTVHAPVPTDGLFPESVALPVAHMDWVEPFVATVGGAVTVMVAAAAEDVHGALLIVHVTT